MMNRQRTRRGRTQPFALWLTGALLVLLLAGGAGIAAQHLGRAPDGAAPRHAGAAGPSASTIQAPASPTPPANPRSLPLRPPGLDGEQTQILARLGHPGKALLVSIVHQTLYVYQGDTLVNWSYVTTGRPQLDTPRGAYTILLRRHAVTFHSPWPRSSPYYYTPVFVNYALRFLGRDFYLHDYNARHYYGPGTNVWHQNPDGTWETGSHGCVEAPLAFMRWVYSWVAIGTPFVVY